MKERQKLSKQASKQERKKKRTVNGRQANNKERKK